MKITDTYLDTLSAKQGGNVGSTATEAGFDQILSSFNQNKAAFDQKDSVSIPERNNTLKSDNNKQADKGKETKNPEKTAKKDRKKAENPEKLENGSIEKENGVETPDQESQTVSTETEGVEIKTLAEEILSNVTDELEIPVDVISQILASLNLQPEELVSRENLNQVVMAFYGVDEPVELLNIENIGTVIEGLEDVVSEAVANFPLEEVAVDQSASYVAAETEMAEATVEIAEDEFTITSSIEEMVLPENDIVPITPEQTGQESTQQNDAEASGYEMNFTNQPIEVEADVDSPLIFSDTEIHNNSFVQNLGKAEVSRSTNPQEVINQIIEKIKVDIKSDVSEIKMILKPENLGEISLKISTENGIVTAQFIAENQKIKEIIESNFNQLKDALTEQGIEISELSVSVSQQDSGQQMQEFLQGRSKSQARINQILRGIADEENLAEAVVPDEKEVYNNKVNYKV